MNFQSWQIWALLSAVFAALTAIFAKIGVDNVNSDLATFIRTVAVLISFLLLLLATGQFVAPDRIRVFLEFLARKIKISDPSGPRRRSFIS